MERLGYDDGGAALWAYTAELLAPYEGLIVRLATELDPHRQAVEYSAWLAPVRGIERSQLRADWHR